MHRDPAAGSEREFSWLQYEGWVPFSFSKICLTKLKRRVGRAGEQRLEIEKLWSKLFLGLIFPINPLQHATKSILALDHIHRFPLGAWFA
jgi:hypothetical protein